MSTPTDRGTNGARWQSPVPCPRLTWDQAAEPLTIHTVHPEDDIDAMEAAALMDAFEQGNAALRASLLRIDDAAGQVEAEFQRAASAIDALDRLRDTRSVEEAASMHAAVLRRHADDGPEDRRRRGFVKPWMTWVVLGVAAVFDASFVGNLTQRIFGVGPHNPMFYLAYLPGIGMALCLLTTGAVLAQNLYRRRMWVSRRRRREPLNPWLLLRRAVWWWREQPQEREPDDLPWYRITLPLLSVVVMVGLSGVIAYIRASQAGTQFAALRDLQPVFVILLLLLSVAAIGTKVLSHNPCADSSEEAAKKLDKMSGQVDKDITTARSAVTEAVKSVSRLRTLINNAECDARSTIERACARMLTERGRRNRAGKLVLPLVSLRWPAQDGVVPPRTELPGLNLAVLDDAKRTFARYQSATLSYRLDRTIGEINLQFHAARSARPQPAGTQHA
jgi:hypothetical protein